MKHMVVLLAFANVGICYADSSSFVIAAQKSYVQVSAKLELAADFVAVPISITSNEKDYLRNLDNIQSVSAKIVDATRKSQNIKLRQGITSLAVSPGNEGNFSSYGSNPSSSTNIYLVSSLTKDRDMFQAAREIISLIMAIPKNEQARVSFGTTLLGIEDPERYRERLLQLVQKEIEHTRSVLGNPKSFEVSGLESAVAVVQQDDRNVAVLIPYKFKVGQ